MNIDQQKLLLQIQALLGQLVTVVYFIAALSGIAAIYIYISEEPDRKLERKLLKTSLAQSAINQLNEGAQLNATSSQRARVPIAIDILREFGIPIQVTGEDIYLSKLNLTCADIEITASKSIKIENSKFGDSVLRLDAGEFIAFQNSHLLKSHIQASAEEGLGFFASLGSESTFDLNKRKDYELELGIRNTTRRIESKSVQPSDLYFRIRGSAFHRTGLAADDLHSGFVSHSLILESIIAANSPLMGSKIGRDRFREHQEHCIEGDIPNFNKCISIAKPRGVLVENSIVADSTIAPPRYDVGFDFCFEGEMAVACPEEPPGYEELLHQLLSSSPVPILDFFHIGQPLAERRAMLEVIGRSTFHTNCSEISNTLVSSRDDKSIQTTEECKQSEKTYDESIQVVRKMKSKLEEENSDWLTINEIADASQCAKVEGSIKKLRSEMVDFYDHRTGTRTSLFGSRPISTGFIEALKESRVRYE